MNSKRSIWKVLLGVVGVGLLVTNCTIKTDDSCTPGQKKNCNACDNGVTGTQTCLDDGTYDACFCPGSTVGGGSNGGGTSGGASSVAGGSNSSGGMSGATTNGGASSASAGEGGEAGALGEGGAAPTVYADCLDCLNDRCASQYAACDADPTCISTDLDGSGQYERIAACIDSKRIKGLVKRDVVRGCGVTIGVSADPDVISEWAPEGMDPVTTALLNCMADAPGATPASWANDDANYPVDSNDMINPTPWPAGTCAKDACTSAL